MPVDLYVGGAEHAVLHLLYSRFWHKVLYDLGLVHTVEPFQKLLNPGMVLGYSYRYYESAESGAERLFSSDQVQLDGETVRHAGTGEELRACWLQLSSRCAGRATSRGTRSRRSALEVVTEKMSKSRGNVVNPDDVIGRFGADTMRLYEMFMGPVEKGAPWSDEAIPGLHRFLQRAHRLISAARRARPRGAGGGGAPRSRRA